MRLKCVIVAIHLVNEQLRIILARHKNFEMQGTRLIVQAAGSVRLEQWQELTPASLCDFNRSNDYKFGHGYVFLALLLPVSALKTSGAYAEGSTAINSLVLRMAWA